MQNQEQIKEEHIRQAGQYIAFFRNSADQIGRNDVREQLLKLLRTLTELRDTEYVFESGEKELNKVYDRYLPYLRQIVENYLRMQEAGNYQALLELSEKLKHIFAVFTDTLNNVIRILPQDEIDEARAQAAAIKLKEELDRRTGRK